MNDKSRPAGQDEALTTPRETRQGGLWRTLARVFLLVTALLLAGRLIWAQVAARQVHEAAQAVLDAGEPLRLSDIPRPTPGADDGWPAYQQLLASAADDGVGMTYALEHKAQAGTLSSPEQARLEADRADHQLMTQLWQDLSRRRDPAVGDTLRERLAVHAVRLDQLRQATQAAHVTWPLGENPVRPIDAELSPLPRLLQFLLAHALLEYDAGRLDAAVDDVSAAVRVSNQLASMPTLQGRIMESYVVQDCAHVLQEMMPQITTADAARLAELSTELSRGSTLAQLRQSLLQSRAQYHTLYEGLASNRLTLDALAGATRGATWLSRAQTWVMRPFMDASEANNLKLYQQVLPLADRPYYELAGALQQIEAQGSETGPTRQWARANLVQIVVAIKMSAMGRTHRQLAAAALAAGRFRAERGEFPPTLEALVPQYVSQLPIDPLTGKPLGYEGQGESPRLYSMGLDLADNGGTCDAENDPLGLQGHDVCFHLSGPPTPATAPAGQPASAAANP